MKVAIAVLLTGWLCACGGASGSGQPSAGANDDGVTSPSLTQGADGPDPAVAKERLLFNANMNVPDSARIVSCSETGVRHEGPPGLRTAIVDYEAELEFTADTYFHDEQKAADREKGYGAIEYAIGNGKWRLLTKGHRSALASVARRLVPRAGVEPASPCGQRILSP